MAKHKELFRAILTEQFGFITRPQAEELAKDFPGMSVAIRWGCGPRERTTLSQLPERLLAGERGGDYERGVFIPAENCDMLRCSLGIKK